MKKEKKPSIVNGKELSVAGRFPRIVKVRSEHFSMVEDPREFIAAVRANVGADILTFIQPVWDTTPRYPYHLEWHDEAVLKFESYESWWKNQLNDKTRNMVRKAAKKGVEIRVCACDDDFIR